MSIKVLVLGIIIFTLVSFRLLVYREKYQTFFLKMRENIQETMHEEEKSEELTTKVIDAEKSEKDYRTIIVFVFIAVLVVILQQQWHLFGKMIYAVAPMAILGIVMGFLGYYEKNPNKKYWLEFGVAIIIEIFLVSTVFQWFEMESADRPFRLKRLGSWFFMIGLWFYYMNRTFRNEAERKGSKE